MDKQSCEIRWTENALSDYNRIIVYLIENWSEKVVTNFNVIVHNKLNILADNSLMGIASEKIDGVRSILLTEHNRLYYRTRNNVIELLNILDTRQNPTKNPY